ncbi:two component transcriptional regulator, sensor histidine kinase [Variovorax paradoxus B4]|uniref:Two component transcriptional regulator, sensor histidine kinase n=2 Tax=Variovorax paradoxus TaxID=34073 RepID=T1XGS9_VARPD|nr:two component transcriptional regulator, sensor histidine kinase [Variovorax paradoxus B4]
MHWLAPPKMAVSLLLAALAALALVGINEAGYRQSSRALADIDAALKVRSTLNQILQNMLDAETGQRGYLLTGEASYRQPYDTAVKQVDGHLAALRQLYAERPAERARLAELSNHVLRKIAEMDMSVRLRQDGKDEAWKFVITTDVGREEMDSIRKTAGELADISSETLHQSQIQVMKSLRLARIGTAIVALAAFIAFFLYLRQAHALRSIGERQQETLQRERNALEDEVRERTASLAELATHLQDVRETERGYLARELHDELGSLLTAAKLDVARLKSRLLEAPDATQRLQHLTELLNSGIALKRRIIEDLRPSSLSNLGLVASLEILGREFAERSGIQVQMALEPVAMDESRQLTIYRMVQESLTNIGKYAEASEATIVLKNYESHAVVEVADNGKGFDPQRVRPSTHGLAGMRHRVETARGKLTISSTPGRGTRVSAMLPIAKPI